MDPRAATRALLDLVEADRAQRCAALEEEGRRTAARVRAESRSRALAQVREALAQERRRLREGLAAIDASLATQLRLHDQRAYRALLDRVRDRLPAALAARWADARGRGDWVHHVVEAARASLPAGEWTLTHAPGWPPREREALAESLERLGIAAAFVEREALGAGLEVRCHGNRVDGTAAGLMADPGEVGARLEERLAARRPAAAEGGP